MSKSVIKNVCKWLSVILVAHSRDTDVRVRRNPVDCVLPTSLQRCGKRFTALVCLDLQEDN